MIIKTNEQKSHFHCRNQKIQNSGTKDSKRIDDQTAYWNDQQDIQ